MHTLRHILYLMLAILMAGCTDIDHLSSTDTEEQGDRINLGGVETDILAVASDATRGSTATRAGEADDDEPYRPSIAADSIPWLIQPLTEGLDITYSKTNDAAAEKQVAILKLQENEDGTIKRDEVSNYAVYTFKYRDKEDGHPTDDDARWHGNGSHTFEGVHVPMRLRDFQYTPSGDVKKAVNLTKDQHDDTSTGTDEQLGNYTLLSHYLGMPANCHINATVQRIKLPFKHRLARVLTFVLIDPVLEGVKLKGYKKDAQGNVTEKEDATTTAFRFCNVDVLKGVKDEYNAATQIHTLTPIWETARKVIPHFDGEMGSYDYSSNTKLADRFYAYRKVQGTSGTQSMLFPSSANWQKIHDAYTAALNGTDTPEAHANAERACGYSRIDYGYVPVYDIIVRPTYSSVDNVMYDEELTGVKTKEWYYNLKNKIYFELSLDNDLHYEKEFTFDLDANYQTVVYLQISREQVDYDSSGAEKWIETATSDDYYGINNDNGNTLSEAGSSWQRAFIYGEKIDNDNITDGGEYNGDGTAEAGQYLTADEWTRRFAYAYEGGQHHGDYFVLLKDITIDASQLPSDFVFTGHLDAQDHTITFTGAGSAVYETSTNYALYPTETLYTNSGSGYTVFKLPEQLYICEEIAQTKPIVWTTRATDASIPAGEGKMTKVSPTLAEIMGNDVTYYTLEGDSYVVYNPRALTFYTRRTGGTALFGGLNGNYKTAQEDAADPYADGVVWEANVHFEKYNAHEFWIPYCNERNGWRAEILNLKTNKMFRDGAVITGNVQNCWENGSRCPDHTPDLPPYEQEHNPAK